MALSSLVTACSSDLTHVASTVANLRLLSESQVIPPLYVWERQSIDAANERGVVTGRTLKTFGLDAHVVTVHCWAATEDSAEDMRAALVKSLRGQLAGANYQLGSARWDYPEWARNGYVLSQSVTVLMPLVDVSIPTQAGTGIPSTDVTNNTATTADIDTVEHDPTGAAADDGYLQTAGEP